MNKVIMNTIIEIGEGVKISSPYESFAYLGEYMQNTIKTPVMSSKDYESCIKGCVLIQNHFKEEITVCGGYENISNLFLDFIKRYPEKEDELADWILKNDKRSTYAPYGSFHCVEARSLKGYQKIVNNKLQKIKENRQSKDNY